MLKEYENQLIVKVSDFGLVKVIDSDLTSLNTEIKGSYNDPQLNIEGFNKYDIQHEIYALTRIVYYVMTGKDKIVTVDNAEFQAFITKGMSPTKTERFKSIDEMKKTFDSIIM